MVASVFSKEAKTRNQTLHYEPWTKRYEASKMRCHIHTLVEYPNYFDAGVSAEAKENKVATEPPRVYRRAFYLSQVACADLFR